MNTAAAARESSTSPQELIVDLRQKNNAESIRSVVEQSLAGRVHGAFAIATQLSHKLDPDLLPSGIAALDDPAVLGGLPRGCLTEICGAPSSGCTTVLLSAMAMATARSEACCLVDATDS